MAESNRISDPRVMRALAHPARIEIVEHLNSTGEVVTATECAQLVGLTPSATSYHLRELAKYGLVEQAPSRGDGRERVWRSTSTHVQIAGTDQEPETLAAERALVNLYLDRDARRLEEWLDRHQQEPVEWQEASAIMGNTLLLTVEELRGLNEKVRELVEPYQMRARRASPPDGAREVRVNYLAFPTP
ncbi:helix-turn-helix domain-containing protein [Actinoplanes sp. NPDC051411]|uniref:ArsR/SmtB family transcription factor n=1 Tax=Actinoplanes sp. NPDC051411 TaxID=3155522 RepID=UPI0034202646